MAKKEEAVYSVPLSKIINDRAFETVYLPDLPENIMISNAGINRPGLQFAGFYDHYEASRLQIIGKVEHLYLASLSAEERAKRLEAFYASRPVGVIYTSSLSIGEDARKFAEKYRVPILRSTDLTSPLMAALIALLSTELAPRLTRHGVLVEVYGEGILLLGDSGIGKSETAIELVKRGHRLIADDAVDIRRVSAKTLVGSSPEIIRHYIELRGIGIVDVCRLFGMYDRLGLEDQFTDILGISVPSIVIPVHPGRNLAIIIEIAAMNTRQKKLGYNTAEEFNKRLMESMGIGP